MKNVIRDAYGFRAYVKVGKHPQAEKHFKRTTAPKTIQAWIDETRVALRKIEPTVGPVGTFSGDVARYLLLVLSMPTYTERKRHLDIWIRELGALMPRRRITTTDIRAVLHRWRHDGLAPATCNKRRAALMHVWTVLDGKGEANPVRGVRKFPVAQSLPRGKDPHVIDAKLRTAPRCRSRACCRVMLWTGMRPVELMRAEPDDLDLKAGTIIVRTAKGGRVRVIPLTGQAVNAWREFEQADAWQKVPQGSPLGRWLKNATGENIRVYDLRHSYGTALARRQTRLDVIGSLMGHSTLELTKRYTLAAVTPDAASATKRLGQKTSSRTPRLSRRTAAGTGGVGRKSASIYRVK
jgi:integrase